MMFSLFVVQKGLCPAAAAKAWGKSRASGEEIRQLARLLHPCPLPLPSSFPTWGLALPLSLSLFHFCPPGPLHPVILPPPPLLCLFYSVSLSPLAFPIPLPVSSPHPPTAAAGLLLSRHSRGQLPPSGDLGADGGLPRSAPATLRPGRSKRFVAAGWSHGGLREGGK